MIITEHYIIQKERWPGCGRHILAQYDNDSILVYQAYNDKIADFAIENQRLNGPHWSTTRMTWIKTNFLWMMFRAEWGTKKNQNRILGIWLKRKCFEKYINMGYGKEKSSKGTVRVQWDPDHYPNGERHPFRKAIQLGLKNIPTFINGEDIVRIEDLTEFVKGQYPCVQDKNFDALIMPKEEIYHMKGLNDGGTGESDEPLRVVLSYNNNQKVVVLYGRDERELLDLIWQKLKVKPKMITLTSGEELTQKLLNTLPQGITLIIK
jgi:hypothetical protein